MSWSAFDEEIAARTAIGEARGEGEAGMQAVIWTGVNRFTLKRWFSAPTLAGTFLKKMQYDCWTPDDPNFSIIANMTIATPLFAQAMAMAVKILAGAMPDPTQGATHYFNSSVCNPVWVAGAMQTVHIGNHTFFKNVA